MTITEFLLARITEDEEAAREVFLYHSSPWTIHDGPAGWSVVRSGGVVVDAEFGSGEPEQHDTYVLQMDTSSTAAHIARHDPARVLAECAAKRRIVEEHKLVDFHGVWDCALCHDYISDNISPCVTLRALAAVYADHPDYDQGWAL